jgi:hypothetical protein
VLAASVEAWLAAMLVASGAARATMLQEKAAVRPWAAMSKLMPAGVDELGALPERMDYDSGSEGDEAWDEAVDAKTRSFAESNRTKSTDIEHERYYLNLSKTAEKMGHKAFMRKALADDKVRFRNIAPVYDRDGNVVVIRPMVLVAILSEMCGNGRHGKKNPRLGDRLMLRDGSQHGAAQASSSQPGARAQR